MVKVFKIIPVNLIINCFQHNTEQGLWSVSGLGLHVLRSHKLHSYFARLGSRNVLVLWFSRFFGFGCCVTRVSCWLCEYSCLFIVEDLANIIEFSVCGNSFKILRLNQKSLNS